MRPEQSDPALVDLEPSAGGVMRLSCNEAEALCHKAARGAGHSWGLAEEAGFAARWLYARGIDGLGALLAHLDQKALEAPNAALIDDVFRAKDGGHLCPIAVGAALSDYAALNRKTFRIEPLHEPILVLPFLHQIACVSDHPMALTWTGGHVVVSAAGRIAGDLSELADTGMAKICVAPAPKSALPLLAARDPATVEGETISRLEAYAMRTTVPASTTSRSDAGSESSDND